MSTLSVLITGARGQLGLELSGATVDEVRVLCSEMQRLLGKA